MSRHLDLLNLTDKHAASNVGYDQAQRFSWFGPGTTIVPNSEGDCSAVTMGLIHKAGYTIPNMDQRVAGRLPCWTGNVRDIMAMIGWKRIDVRGWNLTRLKQTFGPGDALNSTLGHIVLGDRRGLAYSMNIDENGRAVGGKAGDQTGNESSFRELWMYRNVGWTDLYQAPDKGAVTAAPPADVLMVGSTGPRVKALQAGLLKVFPSYAGPIKVTGGADGIFGQGTATVVREFQKRVGLAADGIVGKDTLAQLAKNGIKL